jgi:hypothetical protein
MVLGTQASVFLRYWFGTGVVQITLDGTNVTMIDTRIMPNECGDRPWTSDVLSPDQHILTATHAGGPTIDGMSVDRFVYVVSLSSRSQAFLIRSRYLPAAAPQQGSPTTTASPSPPTGTTGKNKSLIGAIVGSIAGAILLTMGIFFLRRHRGRGTTPEVTTIADDDKVEHVLPRPHDSQDIDLTPNNYPAPSSPRLPADGHPQLTLPPTSILRRPHSQLSDDQLDVVQRLVERNVPAPAIAGIVNSLLQQQSAVVAVQPAARDSRDDAPPMYN